MFQKGHPCYKKKGVKHKATLEKEQRRVIFDQEISDKWIKIINSLKPEYVADQFLGKAPDKVEHSGKVFQEILNRVNQMIENARK